MSNTAQSYVWRLRVHDKSTPRKFLLIRIADMASDDTMSCYAKVGTLAAYLDIAPRRAKEYLSDLTADGHVSVLERTQANGQTRDSRIFVHGPWDAFGGTGHPFPEVTLPKSSKPMDPTQPIKVTAEMREELRRRYSEYAEEFGRLPDGTPRCRWRLGSRAHSIVCWYGVGNIVIHNDRLATVTAVTDIDPKNKPLPQEHVQLHYIDSDTSSETWVSVDELMERIEENPSSEGGDENVPQGGDEIGTPGGTESAPHGGTESSPLGGTESAPHESSSEPKVESSSSSEGEEDEKPSAKKTPSGVRPVDLLQDLTDATDEEATDLWALLRPQVKTSPGGLIRHMAANGDLDYRLGEIRRERASQARAEANEATGPDAVCGEHHEPLPCEACAGLPLALIRPLLRRFGPVRRPDLAARVNPAPAIA